MVKVDGSDMLFPIEKKCYKTYFLSLEHKAVTNICFTYSKVYRNYFPSVKERKLSNSFFFSWQKPKTMNLSSNSCKKAQETLNKNMAWRKLMKLLIVCVTNEKTLDDSGFFLEALMSHENDRKLIFLMEQVL